MQPSAEKNLSAARAERRLPDRRTGTHILGTRAQGSYQLGSQDATVLCSVRAVVRACEQRERNPPAPAAPPTGRVMRMQCMQVGLLFWGAIGAKGAEFSGQVAGEGGEQELYVKGSERRGENWKATGSKRSQPATEKGSRAPPVGRTKAGEEGWKGCEAIGGKE